MKMMKEKKVKKKVMREEYQGDNEEIPRIHHQSTRTKIIKYPFLAAFPQ